MYNSIIVSAALLLGVTAAQAGTTARGVLQHDNARSAQIRAAGIEYTTFELSWNSLEPRPGEYNQAYIEQRRQVLKHRRDAGFKLAIDFGIQYAPAWIYTLPNSRFVNQYGDAYVADDKPGWQMPNMMFSRPVRAAVENYVRKVRELYGDDFAIVRLGWGHYSELNYPLHKYNDRVNCYWAFDPVAQGRQPELLPDGLTATPVPGYIPGQPSPQDEARQFLHWYHGALQNLHDWQLRFARELYPQATLAMLYASWGIRPGEIDRAVANDLNGSSGAEKNGEIQRGFDFARFIKGIRDPKIMAYSTWIDGWSPYCDDDSDNPGLWSPPHWLRHLIDQQPLPLLLGGENTGGDGHAVLARCAERAHKYRMDVVFWAFERHLFPPHDLSLELYQQAFDKQR